MLILLFSFLFLGGSAGPGNLGRFYLTQAKEYIGDEVKDPAREDAAQESAKAAKKGIAAYKKQSGKNVKAFKKLYEDYDSTPEQFDALIQTSLVAQKETVEGIFESRQAMLKSITPGEWTAIIADAKAEDEADARKAAEKAAKKAAKS